MPQFDVFIFVSSIFYLLIGFFSLMIYNQLIFLPKLSAILKLRSSVVNDNNIKSNIKKNKLIKLTKILI